MTLNVVMAVILRYFSEIGSIRSALRKSEDISKLSATEWYLGHPLTSMHEKFYGRSSHGNPSVGGVKHNRGSQI